jgi:hypothetical protein
MPALHQNITIFVHEKGYQINYRFRKLTKRKK